jgi:hypothetical protein
VIKPAVSARDPRPPRPRPGANQTRARNRKSGNVGSRSEYRALKIAVVAVVCRDYVEVSLRPSKARPAALVFIFITLVLDMLALGMIVPVLPRLVEDFVHGRRHRARRIYRRRVRHGVGADGCARGRGGSLSITHGSDLYASHPGFR